MNEVNWSTGTMDIVAASPAAQAFIDKMNAMAAALTTKTPLANETASVAQTGQLAAKSVGGGVEASKGAVLS